MIRRAVPAGCRRTLPWLLTVLVALSVGCEESNDSGEFIPPPIAVRQWTPAPNAQVGPDLTTIEVVLTRAAAPGTLVSWIYPAPLSTAGFAPSNPESRRQWNWLELELDEAAGAYHVIIDGLEMRRPASLSFGVDSDRNATVGLAGVVESPNFQRLDPEPTIVFALRRITSFNPSQPGSWVDAQDDIVAVKAVFDDNASVDDRQLAYRVDFLEEERLYYLVAIQDTNGDLVYDPRDDWWAISRNRNGVFDTFPARPFGGDKESEEIAVDLFMGPPAGREDEGGS